MSVIKIDATNEGNFKQRQIIPPGEYVFEIANEPSVSNSKAGNPMISVELRCQDDGAAKGAVVFDNIVLTKKAEWKLCHLILAAGTQTQDDLKNVGADISLLKGACLKVKVGVEAPTTAPDGTKYPEKNTVERYIFTPSN